MDSSSKTGTDTCGVGVKRKLDENEASTVAFLKQQSKFWIILKCDFQ